MPDVNGTAERVRVVLHSLLAYRGGATRVTDLLARGLRELGHAPERTAETDETLPESVDGGDAACEAVHIAETRGAAQRAREHGAILHLHSTADWSGALYAAHELSLRPVVTLHDVSLLTGGCVYPLACPGWLDGCAQDCPLKFADARQRQAELREAVLCAQPRLVAPSGWLARMARQVFPGLGCRVVPNGVEWDVACECESGGDRDSARRAFGISEQARVAVFLAHGGERAAFKDGAAWEYIWHRVKDAEPRGVAFFVGGDDYAPLDDATGVVRFPYLDRERLLTLLTAADVLVYPSLADNHPLAILEAQSCGTCVAAMGVGGVVEQVRHAENGFLVPPGERKALAAAAARLLGDASLCRRMAEQGRTHGRDRFSHLRMCQDYLKIYAAARD